MNTAAIAYDIGQYLESIGEGVFGQNIFVDMQPDEPDELITVLDMGSGAMEAKEPPEAWRDLYIQIRTKDYQTGFERIWRLLNVLTRPHAGIIVTSGGNYISQLQDAPVGNDRDQKDRVLFGFRILVQNTELAYFIQTTVSPDPVKALYSWVNSTFSEVQTIPAEWAPTDSAPALYWRLTGLQAMEQQQAVTWHNATIMGHIIAPTASGRLTWLKRLTESLVSARRLPMEDDSPLFIANIGADSNSDYLRQGQLRVTARFGVLQPAPATEVLRRAVAGGAVTGEVT